MGDRVYGWAQVGPWDGGVVVASEEGQALLAAIEAIGFEESDETEVDGVRLLCLGDGQCNYGTSAFEDDGLVEVAVAAGLWIAVGDVGSVEWGPHHSVYAPSGRSWDFEGETGSVTVTSSMVAETERVCGGDAATTLAKLHEYFTLGNRSLRDWIVAEQVGVAG